VTRPSTAGAAPGPDKDPAKIAGMFDAIAPRYDLLNHVLSGGADWYWRARAVRHLGLTGHDTVLDLCTGTTDLAAAAAGGRRPGARRVVGIDFSGEMLRIGQRKLRHAGLGGRVPLVRGDAVRLPLREASVDAAMIAFGIRNVADPSAACRELWRVVRPSGRLAVLEFGMPEAPLLKTTYRWYFRAVLPRLGRLVSRHRDAYTYLPESVGAFFPPDGFTRMLQEAGFVDVRAVRLTFGIVYLYTAVRSRAAGPDLPPTGKMGSTR